MISVKLKDSENFDKLLKRFKNIVRNEKIIETYKDNQFFDKKKIKKKKKK